MRRQSGQLFYEKQRFPLSRIGLVLATPPTIMLGLLIWQVVLGHTWGKQPMSNDSLIGWTIFLWLVYLRLITVRLIVEVGDGELRIGFHGLWRTRRVPVGDIQSAETVTFDPLRDWGGYGIRSSRQGKAYIANGNRGVKLKLAQGRTLVVGSQRPEELAGILLKPSAAETYRTSQNPR